MANYTISNQIFVTLIANISALIFGMMMGWSSAVKDRIVDNENYYFPVTSFEFSLIVALMPLGAATTCIFVGFLRKILGTRLTIFIFGAPCVIGYILITLPINLKMIMGGRYLIGIAAGCYVYIPILYVGEIASVEIRGFLLALFFFMANCGILCIFIIGHYFTLFALNTICCAIPIIYSISFLFLPESPPMLISQDRIDDARCSIKYLRGERFNCEAEIDDLKIRHQASLEKKGFRKVFSTKSTRKALFLIIGIFFFFQLSGIHLLSFYSLLIFTEAGFDFLSGMSSIIVASIQLISCCFALASVDRFGRRILFIISSGVMTLSLIGIATYFQLQRLGVDVYSFMLLPLILFCIFVIAFSIGLAPVTYILLGEIFLQEAKIYVAPIAKVLNFLLSAVIAVTFLMLVESVGFGVTFYIFAFFNFMGFLYGIFFIPETKGASLSEIQTILCL